MTSEDFSVFLVERLTMGLKQRVASVLATGAIFVGAMLAAPAAQATGDPNRLDRGDLSLACKLQYGQQGWAAQLTGSGAYGWKCVYVSNYNDQRHVDVNNYCMHYWGVWSQATNPNDPYSWRCQV
ncbi:MAG TPA: hypothetical protein VFZ48_02480 [Candidatus Saccharimonadales bacterium]